MEAGRKRCVLEKGPDISYEALDGAWNLAIRLDRGLHGGAKETWAFVASRNICGTPKLEPGLRNGTPWRGRSGRHIGLVGVSRSVRTVPTHDPREDRKV